MVCQAVLGISIAGVLLHTSKQSPDCRGHRPGRADDQGHARGEERHLRGDVRGLEALAQQHRGLGRTSLAPYRALCPQCLEKCRTISDNLQYFGQMELFSNAMQ